MLEPLGRYKIIGLCTVAILISNTFPLYTDGLKYDRVLPSEGFCVEPPKGLWPAAKSPKIHVPQRGLSCARKVMLRWLGQMSRGEYRRTFWVIFV